METRRVRLGAVIDDYCPRCRLMMNHGVVGMVGDEVRKVRCNTCITEHVYKHGQLPKRRRTETDRLFKEVLKGMGRDADEDDKRPVEPSPERESETPDRRAAESQETPDEDRPAATQPPAPSADPRDDAPLHGVRRKLYTISRHTGGKPPGSGGGTPRG